MTMYMTVFEFECVYQFFFFFAEVSINCFSNINCNYVICFDYDDNLLKKMKILNNKFKT